MEVNNEDTVGRVVKMETGSGRVVVVVVVVTDDPPVAVLIG
jgi:hypothetical protein